MSAALRPDFFSQLDWQKPDYTPVYEHRIAMLERLRKPGFDVQALRDYYAARPVEFIEDWGQSYDPRLPELGLSAIVPLVLFPKQRAFIEFVVDHWRQRRPCLIEKSRDVGASVLTMAIACWMFIFHTGTSVGVGSRKELMVDSLGNYNALLPKCRMFISLLPIEFQPAGWDEAKHGGYMKLLNPENGSSIFGEAGDQIGRGARSSIYFLDEAAFVERSELVDAALSQTTNSVVRLSTPNGVGNSFHRLRFSGKIDVFTFRWTDDPRKDQAWRTRMEETLDAQVIAQEIDCDYGASSEKSWITGRVASAAARRGPGDVMPYGPVMWGLDVARFGKDKTCLIRRQGRVVTSVQILSQASVTEVAGWARNIIDRDPEPPGQIAVDTIGIGAGVADILRDYFDKRLVVDVNSALRLSDGQNYNARAKMWRDMRDWLEAGASIPTDCELESQLVSLQYSFRGGELLIESKDDAKKRGVSSPDQADAVALTFFRPAKPMDRHESMTPAWQAIDQLAGY